MTPSRLAVVSLVKAFDAFRAVDDVSFAVAEGEVVALIGPNGAGKTTTFNIINGQLVADAGRVLLDGRDITGAPPRHQWRHGIARTFQVTATFASMTVAENIGVALASRAGPVPGIVSRSFDADAAEVARLLDEVGMTAAASLICGTLSYGDLKRVDLALALSNAPRLLLMDEPTAGMAKAERDGLMRLAVRRARERRTAVLFTEHDMDIVFGHADRVLVMSRGKLIADGSPEEVRRDPRVRVVYLGTAGMQPEG